MITPFKSRANHLNLNRAIFVKPALPLLLSLTLTVTSPMTLLAAAATKHAAHRGGGGGVYLNTPNPTNPLEHNNRGVELGMKGLWPQAIAEGEMALEGDPENDIFKRNLSGAHLHFGDNLQSKKSFPAAVKQFREALFVDPENGPAENGLNSSLSHLGKTPGDLAYRLGLAAGAESTGEYKIAVVEYRICSHIQDSGINSFKLGRCLLKVNKIPEGFESLRIALRKDWPKDDQDALVECHLLLADTLLNFAYVAKKQPGRGEAYAKRLNNAMVEYRRAATINPSNMAAVHGLTEAAREAVSIQPSFANLLALGSAYLLQTDFDHAKSYFEKAWKVNPASPDLAKARLSFHRAVVETPQGLVAPMRVAETVQKVEDLLAKTPNDPDLLYILGRGKARMGDNAGAMDALQKSLAKRPYDENTKHALDLLRGGGEAPQVAAAGAMGGTPGSAAPAGTGSGAQINIPGGANPAGVPGAPGAPAQAAPPVNKNAEAYAKIDSLIKSSSLDEAAKGCDAVLNATPADGQAWYLKGQVMEKKADLDEASVCYRQAAGLKIKEADDALKRINDMRAKPMLGQADALSAKSDWAGAGEILREVTSLSPKDAALWRKYGDVLKKAGDDKGSERAYKKAEDAAKAK
jgi:tetratricopeptide (TPR) repeat protein